jgi:hypothetical protein
VHYADEARQRIGPALEALGPRLGTAAGQARAGSVAAAHSTRAGYREYVAPRLEQSFTKLPPHTQETVLKAVHRAQEAALAAKHSADRAATQARENTLPKLTGAFEDAKATALPLAQEAQSRGSAALTALQGKVTAAQVDKLAAKNARRQRRHGAVTGLAIAGTVAVGSGVLLWQWWRRQSEPEWLIEPPEVQGPPNAVHPATGTLAEPDGSGPAAAEPTDGPDGEQRD